MAVINFLMFLLFIGLVYKFFKPLPNNKFSHAVKEDIKTGRLNKLKKYHPSQLKLQKYAVRRKLRWRAC